VRATSPYSIGALAGKDMHDACRMRAFAGAKGRAIALAALVFCLSGRAYADAGPETDNALATLCVIVESSAKAEGLPVDFFTKLIWRESSFRPNAVSPAGAQGVAQFMPGTASERGLVDPFDPASAIPASARFLNELTLRFGNLGLAAAAYNAGPTALARWLVGKGSLPFETQEYVLGVTGHDAEEWRSEKPPAGSAPGTAPSCPPRDRAGFRRRLGLVRALGRADRGQLFERLCAARLRPRPARLRKRDRGHEPVRARLRPAEPRLAAVLPRPLARSDRRRSTEALRAHPGRRRRLRCAEELARSVGRPSA
jgi:Transglycosylase SLT domain